MSLKKQLSPRQKGLPLGIPEAVGRDVKNGYDPLPSVWFGEDSELLDKMLHFYPHKIPKKILDATVNTGRIWRGLSWEVVGLDIDPAHNPTVVGDNTDMPFDNASFDVVVYDPPHIPNQGKDQLKGFQYAIRADSEVAQRGGLQFFVHVSAIRGGGAPSAAPEGILLCKIADYIHGHRYQWAHLELIDAARRVGFCPCDCIVKVRKGPIVDPRWKNAHHARRQHCYWLVFRKSKYCE